MTTRCVWTGGARRRLAAASLALALLCGCAPRKPNVLLITLDTTRADHLGCYGWTNAATPVLDRLAAEGVRYEHAQTVVPITLPAHATILTGLLPPEHGLRVNFKSGLSKEIPTIAETFRAAGYRTGAFTAFSVLGARYGLNRGFDRYDAPELDPATEKLMRTPPQFEHDGAKAPYRRAGDMADRAISWLRGGGARKPWFLWVHFYDPHYPWHWNRAQVGDGFALPYDAEIAYMDQSIGRVLAHLDAEGLSDNTVVVAVGDHGEGLGDHGEQTHQVLIYEATMRIPLILRFPERLPRGRSVETPVSLVQLAPTLIDLAGVEPLASQQGIWRGLKQLPDPSEGTCRADSLVRRVDKGFALSEDPGGGAVGRPGCYLESDVGFLTYNWAPLRGLRKGAWKYIRAPEAELYNLASDPHELNNLADSVESNRVAAMERGLAEWEDLMIRRTGGDLEMSREDLRLMASMGYLAGGQTTPTNNPMSLPDPKAVIQASVWSAAIAQREGRDDSGDETLQMARGAVRLSPATPRFHSQLARILDRRGAHAEALEAWSRALELDATQADSWNGKAMTLVKLRREPEALPCFREAYRIEPSLSDARRNLILSLNNVARLAANARQFAIADKLIDEGATLEPDNPGWALSRAGVRLAAGEREAAVAILRKTLEDNPDYRPAADALRQVTGTGEGK